MTNYPPFPDNKTRADYDFGSSEREMASLVVVVWGQRLGMLLSVIGCHVSNPNRNEAENAELKKYMTELDFALQAMEDWKEFRKHAR